MIVYEYACATCDAVEIERPPGEDAEEERYPACGGRRGASTRRRR